MTNYLVVLVVDDVNDCPKILNTWEEIGVSGVTILNSTGLNRVRQAGLFDDIPLIPSIQDMFQSAEERHRTLLSVVEGQEMVDKMVEVAQEIIAGMDTPHSGFLFVVPVSQIYRLGTPRTDG
jgi:nitrogen regulatory protein P-II 1